MWLLDLQHMTPPLSVQNCCSGFCLPPTLDILEESWWEPDLLRFWFFRLLAALTDRRSTSLALKKATMNGCFDWGPCLPTRPADFTLMLCPRTERRSTGFMKKRWSLPDGNELRGYLQKGRLFKTLSECFLCRPKILINMESLLLQTIIHAWFSILYPSLATEHRQAFTDGPFSDLEVGNVLNGKA